MKNSICHVIGGGEYEPGQIILKKGDCLIACDSGLGYLQTEGLTPHLTVGDFDSYVGSESSLPENTLRLPREKDDTDLLYGLKAGLEKGYRHFLLYGSLGGSRFSHSIANVMALSFLLKQNAFGVLVGKNTLVALLNKDRVLPDLQAEYLSVFPYGGEADISLEGFHYPFDGILPSDFPIGVSNEQSKKESRITLRKGQVLLIVEGKNTDPSLLF